MKILFVETHADEIALLKSAFEDQETTVRLTTVGTLADARTIIHADPAWDVVLATPHLPDGSGLDLIAQIRLNHRPTAAVLLTDAGEEAPVFQGLEAGADDIIIKHGNDRSDLPSRLIAVRNHVRAAAAHRPAILRVLYADPHADTVERTRHHFSRHAPYICLTSVGNARALLNRLPQTPSGPCPFDVILTDFQLPGMPIVDLLHAILRHRALALPVVILSDPGSADKAVHCLRMGVSDCLVKHAHYLDQLAVVLGNAGHRARLHKAQTTRLDSEERFRELFMNMHDGVAIYRPSDNGADFIIQGVNPAGARLVRVDAKAVVGRSVQAVFPGIVEMGLLDVFRSVWHTGLPRQHPFTHYKDGKIRLWVENYVCRIGTGEIVAIFRDLTAQKNAEKQLRQSEQTLKTVINASPNYVYVRDDRGAYLLANETIANLYGLPEREMIGRTDAELAGQAGLDVADIQAFCRHDADVLSRQQPLTVAKEHFIRTDGTVHWLRTATIPIRLPGHPRCVLGVATDVTDQVSAEEQRALLFTAIAQSPEAIIITDRDGRIQYVNPGFETITGYSQAEVVGKSTRFLNSGQQDEAFYHSMWQTLTEGCVWSGRIVNRRKNGELFTEEATISPVVTESGRITHYVAVKRDISKEIEIETRLRQSQKMEAIGTLAGGIAHDFNNILTSTIGFTELALDEAEKGSPLEDYLKEIRISGMRARDLVNQILAFAHQTEEHAKPLKLGSIVKEVVKLLRATVPATITIHLNVEREVTVLADATQIHQVCMNLCANAIQAMEEGVGNLTISLEDVFLEAGVDGLMNQCKAGRYGVLAISDTGSGIPEELMGSIFEPYFTTKDVGEGTGLGLAVVHGIVNGYGGDIQITSSPGQGTCFKVFLPCIENLDTPEASSLTEHLPGGTERILIVDDELVIARMGARMLERKGYRVTIRTSSIEALGLFENNPQAFDLVLTDMTMPNLTGDRLAAELLAIRPDLPVVLCTGYNKKINADTAATIGVRALLMKPFSTQDMLPLVRRILDGERFKRESAERLSL